MSVATLWKTSLYFAVYCVLICNKKAKNKNTVFREVLQLVLKCVNKVSWELLNHLLIALQYSVPEKHCIIISVISQNNIWYGYV